jgi:hypothetical protein
VSLAIGLHQRELDRPAMLKSWCWRGRGGRLRGRGARVSAVGRIERDPEGQEATAGYAPGDHERLTDPVPFATAWRPGPGWWLWWSRQVRLVSIRWARFDLMSPVPRTRRQRHLRPTQPVSWSGRRSRQALKAATPAHAGGLNALGRPSACALSRRPAPPWIASASSGRLGGRWHSQPRQRVAQADDPTAAARQAWTDPPGLTLWSVG